MGLGELFEPRSFALGMIALINPCGFALLPAYLGYFVGLDNEADGSGRRGPTGGGSRLVAMNRAQVVGASMTVGFLVVFGVLGLGLTGVMTTLGNSGALYWLTVVIGVGLVVLGVAMLAGHQPYLSVPRLELGTQNRSLTSMFLFGVSYAIASLACTIPLFLNAVAFSTSGATFTGRLGGYLSYAVGMGLLTTGLTVAIALGNRSLVNRFRRLLPRINLISAVLVIIVGIYVTWYGWYSTAPISNPAGPVTWVEARQRDLQNWIDARTVVLGWGFLALNLALVIAGAAARRSARQPHPV